MQVITGNILLVLVVIEIVVVYIFWRKIYSAYGSKFRSLDLILFSLLLGVMTSRVVGLLMGLSLSYEELTLTKIVSISDLDFDYLVFLYLPLLVLEFFSIHVEIKKDWRKIAYIFILLGSFLTLPIIFMQIFRSIHFGWPSEWLIYHTGQFCIVLLVAALIMYFHHNKQLTARTLMFLVFSQCLCLSVFTWFTSVVSLRETTVQIATQAILFLLGFIPFLSVLQKKSVDSSESRPPVSRV